MPLYCELEEDCPLRGQMREVSSTMQNTFCSTYGTERERARQPEKCYFLKTVRGVDSIHKNVDRLSEKMREVLRIAKQTPGFS